MTTNTPKQYDLELQLAHDGSLTADMEARSKAARVAKTLQNSVGFSIGVDLASDKVTCIAWGGQPNDYKVLAEVLIKALQDIAEGVGKPAMGSA